MSATTLPRCGARLDDDGNCNRAVGHPGGHCLYDIGTPESPPTLKEPSFSEGMIAGHGVGMEIARLEIRRAIAPALREMRKMCRCESPYCVNCNAIATIDRATRRARAKGKR